MFHPRPFVKTRFAPQGAVACMTAISDFYYTVMFRYVLLRAPPPGLSAPGTPGKHGRAQHREARAFLEAPSATTYHPLVLGKQRWLSGPQFPHLWVGWW